MSSLTVLYVRVGDDESVVTQAGLHGNVRLPYGPV